MKVVRIHQNGGVEQLRIDEMDKPSPGPSQILLQVKCAALNRLDIWVRKGIPGTHALPLVLGSDASGVVVEVGSGVSRFKLGDRIVVQPGHGCGMCIECLGGREHYCPRYGILGEHFQGVQSEYIVLDERHAVSSPPDLSFEEAAALPLVSLTAWEMVVNKGRLRWGETVLVSAASSGVGCSAVQIALALGARVIATAGTTKLDKARALGAHAVVDHYKDDVARQVKTLTEGRGADLVIDSVGAALWPALMRSLAKGGRLVTCGATTGPEVQIDLRFLYVRQQSILGSTMGSPADLYRIMRMVESKKIRGIVDQVFHFTEVAKAHEYLESGKHFGKVLLHFSN